MPRTSPRFALIDDGQAVKAAGRRLEDGSPVMALVGGRWHAGELQLGRRPAGVWVESLGHVALEDVRGVLCLVLDLRPAAPKAPRRPAA